VLKLLFPRFRAHGNLGAVRSLEPPDSHYLRAAMGWLELGNATAAEDELGHIASSYRSHPDVLEMRWHICGHAGCWEAAVNAAATSVQQDPDRPGAWVHRSYALHELKRTQEALEQLLPAAERFPEVWTIPYNLACYCAQLGRLPEARDWLQRTFSMAADFRHRKELRLQALRDPDLAPLRAEIGDLGT